MTITEALAQLEQAIKSAPPLSFEEARLLWRKAEELTEALEVLMLDAPDYPGVCDICGKLGATEQEDGAVLCAEHAAIEPTIDPFIRPTIDRL